MIDPSTFREAIRTTTVSYPVPFIFGLLLLFSLLCFGGGFAADGGLRWLLAGTASVSALTAFISWGYALLRKPELLRSERHALLVRYFEALGNKDMDPKTRERVSNAILAAAEQLVPKSRPANGSRTTQLVDKEKNDG